MTLPLSDTASEVAALRDKIRTLLPAPPAADAVIIFDGPDTSRAFAPRAVTIAAPFEEDQESVAEDRVESGAGPVITTVLTVAGSVYAGGGSMDMAEHRATAGSIMQAIDDGLRADRTLGGVVARARVATARWIQGRDEKGSGAMIGFTVELVSMP